jgi:hypothetical protein
VRYFVTITESVEYRILVDADSEDEAREQAIDAHNDGLSSEVDSREPVVETVEVMP